MKDVRVDASRYGTRPSSSSTEAPMVDEEWEVLDEIMEDGAGILTQVFTGNHLAEVLQGPGVQNEEPQIQDVVFEDEILLGSEEEDENLFDLF